MCCNETNVNIVIKGEKKGKKEFNKRIYGLGEDTTVLRRHHINCRIKDVPTPGL